MTILAGVISVLLIVALTAGGAEVGEAAALDARAQTAADAAALAAVAEAAPGGSGQPVPVARRYAEMNGARLVTCICDVSASAVQVTVAIGDATARARAVFDASLARPAR